MFSMFDVKKISDVFPWFIYQRVQMVAGRNYMFHALEPGYWYIAREVRSKWAEIDSGGVTFAPEIYIEFVENCKNRRHQRAPIPLRLMSSPSSQGVQETAAGEMTATQYRGVVKLADVHPQKDNVIIELTGQNATPFPAFVDVCIVGYMVPVSMIRDWSGG